MPGGRSVRPRGAGGAPALLAGLLAATVAAAQAADPRPPSFDAWFEGGVAPVFTRSETAFLAWSLPTPTAEGAEATTADTEATGALGRAEEPRTEPASPGALRRADAAPAPRPGRPVGSGRAVWYEHPGRTASGEIFDPNRLTAAHRTLPLGSTVRVVNRRNGRSVLVRINDRGPPQPHLLIDLSRASARAIGIDGVGEVALYRLDRETPGQASQATPRITAATRAMKPAKP